LQKLTVLYVGLQIAAFYAQSPFFILYERWSSFPIYLSWCARQGSCENDYAWWHSAHAGNV